MFSHTRRSFFTVLLLLASITSMAEDIIITFCPVSKNQNDRGWSAALSIQNLTGDVLDLSTNFFKFDWPSLDALQYPFSGTQTGITWDVKIEINWPGTIAAGATYTRASQKIGSFYGVLQFPQSGTFKQGAKTYTVKVNHCMQTDSYELYDKKFPFDRNCFLYSPTKICLGEGATEVWKGEGVFDVMIPKDRPSWAIAVMVAHRLFTNVVGADILSPNFWTATALNESRMTCDGTIVPDQKNHCKINSNANACDNSVYVASDNCFQMLNAGYNWIAPNQPDLFQQTNAFGTANFNNVAAGGNWEVGTIAVAYYHYQNMRYWEHLKCFDMVKFAKDTKDPYAMEKFFYYAFHDGMNAAMGELPNITANYAAITAATNMNTVFIGSGTWASTLMGSQKVGNFISLLDGNGIIYPTQKTDNTTEYYGCYNDLVKWSDVLYYLDRMKILYPQLKSTGVQTAIKTVFDQINGGSDILFEDMGKVIDEIVLQMGGHDPSSYIAAQYSASVNCAGSPLGISLRSDDVLCPGDPGKLSVWLSGDTPFKFTLEFPNGTSKTYSNISYSPYVIDIDQPGKYEVTYFEDADDIANLNCIFSSKTIPQKSNLYWDKSNVTAGCATGPLKLTLSGNGPWTVNYKIDGVNQAAVNIPAGTVSPYTVKATPGGGTYILTGGGCGNDTIKYCSSCTAPTVSATTTTASICKGASAILTATPAAGVTYKWDDNTTLVNRTVTPTTTTTYTVTATNTGNTCSAAANVTVTVIALPTANAGASVSICKGASTTLTASGGTTYQWNGTGPATATYAVTPASTTTYTVTATTSGCSASDSLIVTIKPLPTANAGTSVSICKGASTTLTASGGTTYQWNGTGPATATYAVTPAATTTYTVTATTNGCTGSDSLIVTIKPLPTANAGTSVSICPGASTTLSATGGTTYQWNGTGPATATYAVTPASTTTYTVTATTNGCTGSDSLIVTVKPLPTANAGTSVSICPGASTTLSASGGTTYQWNGTGPASATYAVTPASTTTYTVTATTNGCTGSDSLIVTVKPLPTANAGTSVSICPGASTTLSASGGTTYQWNGTGPATATYAVTPASTTTYTVTATTNGCTGSDSLIVTVKPIPAASAGVDAGSCNGSTASLTASGGGTYAWNNGATTAVISEAPSVTTTYTVTVTSNGCTASDNAVITSVTTPLSVTGTTICKGDTATIFTGGGADTYIWSTSATTASIDVFPITTTTYSVTISLTGCTASGSCVVNVNALPTAAISADNNTVCPGATANLTATGGTTYAWSTLQTTANIAVTPAAKTTYTVAIADANLCTDTETIIIDVHPGAVPDAGADATICAGNSTGLTASGGTYAWSTGATTAAISVSPGATTTYTVTVTASSGCTATDNVSVIVNALPTANAGNDVAICIGQSAALTASGGATYLWSNSATTAAISVSPATSSNYSVTVTSAAGCSASDFLQVTVNPLPVVSAGNDAFVCKDLSQPLAATVNSNWNYAWTSGNGGTLNNSNIENPQASLTAAITGDYPVNYIVAVTDKTTLCVNRDTVMVTFEFVCKPRVTLALNNNTICVGQSTTLSANATWTDPLTYTWSDGTLSNTGPFTVNPTATTTYHITVADADDPSKSDRDTIVLTVNALPIPSAGADAAVCLGTSANLTASGGTAYAWSNSISTANNSVTPSVKTTYTVTVTDANLCSAADDVVVDINPLPVASAGSDVSVCPGTTASLSASGGTLYAWSNSINNAANPVAPPAATTYIVSVTDANGCTDTDDVVVSLYATPSANAGGDVDICIGQAAALTASGGVSYLWNTLETSAAISPSPSTNTTYSVGIVTADGCTDSDEVAVTVNPLPIASAGPDDDVCEGSSFTLNASGGTTYKWNDNSNNASKTVTSITLTTTYSVTVTDANNCSASDEVVMTFNKKPTVTISTFTPVCVSSNTLALTSGSPAGGSYSGSGVSGSNFDASVAQVGVHPITYTFTDALGCTNTATESVTVLALPVVNIADINICEGGSATLSAGNNSQQYSWDDGNTSNVRSVSPTTTSTYLVTATAGGCEATDQVVVTVHPLPTVDYTASGDNGCQPFTVSFYDNSSPAGAEFSWNFGDGDVSSSTTSTAGHIYDADGIYTLTYTVKTAAGCTNTKVFPNAITVMPRPNASFTYSPTDPTNFDPLVTFTDLSVGNVQKWLWRFDDTISGKNISSSQNPEHSFSQPGTYKVMLTVGSDKNCSDSVTATIYVKADHTFFIPNAFTPNDDGYNEEFMPLGMGIDPDNFHFYVYSRWGELIYQTDTYGMPWQGRKNNQGDVLPPGSFAWICIFNDLAGTEYKYSGSVMLMR